MRKLTTDDMAAIIGTTNQDYEIKQARVKGGGYTDSDHYGIVLAARADGNYATWQFHLDEDEQPNYYWGHYFSEDKEKAVLDYETRE